MRPATISTNDIQNNAITAKKIKKNAVTGGAPEDYGVGPAQGSLAELLGRG